MKILRYKVMLQEKRRMNIHSDRAFATGMLDLRKDQRRGAGYGKGSDRGFIACMIARGEEVSVETDDSLICTVAVMQIY
jgi:hypothetical protein